MGKGRDRGVKTAARSLSIRQPAIQPARLIDGYPKRERQGVTAPLFAAIKMMNEGPPG
jgi:hypothetical protein